MVCKFPGWEEEQRQWLLSPLKGNTERYRKSKKIYENDLRIIFVQSKIVKSRIVQLRLNSYFQRQKGGHLKVVNGYVEGEGRLQTGFVLTGPEFNFSTEPANIQLICPLEFEGFGSYLLLL